MALLSSSSSMGCTAVDRVRCCCTRFSGKDISPQRHHACAKEHERRPKRGFPDLVRRGSYPAYASSRSALLEVSFPPAADSNVANSTASRWNGLGFWPADRLQRLNTLSNSAASQRSRTYLTSTKPASNRNTRRGGCLGWHSSGLRVLRSGLRHLGFR